MFYETAKRDHGLPHDPLKAIVAPRPIGWISSLSAQGVPNLAPYSFFNLIASRPDLVMFSSETEKDSLSNIRATGEFVVNHVGQHLAEAMNQTSVPAPNEVDEFDFAGIEAAPSRLVKPPRVAAAYAALECRLVEIHPLKDANGNAAQSIMTIGEIVGVHIDETVLRDGRFDVAKARPVTRLGYRDYARQGELFEMTRPDWGDVSGEAQRRA